MDRTKMIRLLLLLSVITLAAGGFVKIMRLNSISLEEYEKLNAAQNSNTDSPGNDEGSTRDGNNGADSPGNDEGSTSDENSGADSPETENLQDPAETITPVSLLTGASLNGDSQLASRITHAEGFYYEPISDGLGQYMTGISYPDMQTQSETGDSDTASHGTEPAPIPEITLDELRYVHILLYDFDGNPAEGELICNEYIAQDLVEIFYELYSNRYPLEKVLLIDEYGGDDTASMEDNNTSCFNYRPIAGSTRLSQHAYGLAIDVNPLYNPYIAYREDGSTKALPVSGMDYADRSLSFPYKISREDLCYQLFTRHGFTWGGSWKNPKDYQHFEKQKP